jgi:hypothetical protein
MQVAGIDRVDVLVRQAPRQRRRLPPAGLVQLHIGLPLVASLDIPGRFAMTRQDQPHHHQSTS